MKSFSRILLLGSLALLFSCGRNFPHFKTQKSRWEGSFRFDRREELCQKGIDGFSKTVHVLLRKDCMACHDEGGFANNPHSASDPLLSYRRILGYVNWTDRPNSFLVRKGGNQHCLEYGGNCVTTKPEMARALEAWWESGQKECPLPGMVSRPVKGPSEGQGEMRKLSFDMSHHLVNSGKVLLTVDVTRTQGTYFLERPKISTSSTAIRVRDMGLMVNGVYFLSVNGWSTIQARVNPGIEDFALLAGQRLVLPTQNKEGDEFSISLTELSLADSFQCHKGQLFQRDVLPILQRRGCYDCHGGGPDNLLGEVRARESLFMGGAESELCTKLLARGSGKFAIDSPLLALPLRRALNHPAVIPFGSEVLPAWVDWIRVEGVHQ